ncbi:MAG: ABC transporter ATP-binding protein [Actinomycetaceae bacterium]|nr:ABC transporter ATP-binding protein [Actinomycetaceae bacterium]
MGSPLPLSVQHVRRTFHKGNFVAVDDLSLEVSSGQIHALLGPNGAGKTTTVRMCATLLEPTSGSVVVDGIDAVRHPRRARSRLGLVLGGDLGFYGRASARDNLAFFADLQGVPSRDRSGAVSRVLELVSLSDFANTKVQEFSRGMKQRLHLARAALTRPALLLLDEPTTGLDPDIALRIRDVIRSFSQSGIGVLLTSHSMPEVEELADTITLLGAGRVHARGSVQTIASAAGIEATTTFSVAASEIAHMSLDALDDVEGVRVVKRPHQGNWSLTIYWPQGKADVRDHLLHRTLGEVQPADLLTRRASLEESYLALAEGLAR